MPPKVVKLPENTGAYCDPAIANILQDIKTLSENQAAAVAAANAALDVAATSASDLQSRSLRSTEANIDQAGLSGDQPIVWKSTIQEQDMAGQVQLGVIHSDVKQPQFYQQTLSQQPQQPQQQNKLQESSPGYFLPAVQAITADSVLTSTEPIDVSNPETISVQGQSGLLLNKTDFTGFQGPITLDQYPINEDQNPDIIQKISNKQLIYTQEIAIRYLRPPTPPPPGDILIIQEKNIPVPPAPPIVLRQQPPRPDTPPPLVIREAPPKPPCQITKKLVTISGKLLPPPPRKVIIERLAPLPSKPQSVIIERWLPYAEPKRRVIYQKSTEPDIICPKQHNVIIQWNAPTVSVVKEFRDLGVIRANPADYVDRFGPSLKQAYELPDFVKQIRPPNGMALAADSLGPKIAQLEGDVSALSLIDLQKEGLIEYVDWLAKRQADASLSSVLRYTLPLQSQVQSEALPLSGLQQQQRQQKSESALLGKQCDVCHKTRAMYDPASQLAQQQIVGSVLQSQWDPSGGNVKSKDQAIHDIFNMIDTNDDGYATEDEVRQVLMNCNERLGTNYTEDDLRNFMNTLDRNHDGKIDYAELKKALSSCT
jgi:hypothetical protein